MTAADYAAMYRHVVLRLRFRGVANAIFVMDYSATAGFGTKSWFPRLWPGDDVVDWVGYSAFGPAGTSLSSLVNRASSKWPGFYTWATTTHPTKPLMLAEWGIYGSTSATAKAASFASVAAEVPQFPLIRAFVYEEFGSTSTGTRPDTDAAGLAAFGALGQNPSFISPVVVLQ
jgi:beta-mannanase